jgi:hypothetical protein
MTMHVTTLLADAYRFVIGNFRQIAALFLPLLLIVTALGYGSMETADTGDTEDMASVIRWLLINLLFYPLYTGALILLLAKRTRHETPTNGQLLRAASALWWPLLILTSVAGIAIVFGLMLLIIPGIWIAVRLAFAEIYLVVEGLAPLAAMRKSHDTTKELFWVILAVVASIYVPLIALSYLFELMVQASGGGIALKIITEGVVAFLGLFVNVAIFRIYLLHNADQVKE